MAFLNVLINGSLCSSRPLLEVPLIVVQTNVDALDEVVGVGDGPKEVGLDQRDVVQFTGGSCASLSTSWVHENLKHTKGDQRKQH